MENRKKVLKMNQSAVLVIIIIVMLMFFKIIDALAAIISPEMSVYFSEIIPFLIMAVIMIYMLRKSDKKKSAVIIVTVTAVIFAVNMIDYYVIKRDWLVTTASITGVDHECGGFLCGSYIDENGKWQRQDFDAAALFCRSVLMSFPYGSSCYDRLRGMQVLIYYDPDSVFRTDYYEIYLNKSELCLFVKMNIYLSAISLTAALVYLITVRKQNRKYVEKET